MTLLHPHPSSPTYHSVKLSTPNVDLFIFPTRRSTPQLPPLCSASSQSSLPASWPQYTSTPTQTHIHKTWKGRPHRREDTWCLSYCAWVFLPTSCCSCFSVIPEQPGSVPSLPHSHPQPLPVWSFPVSSLSSLCLPHVEQEATGRLWEHIRSLASSSLLFPIFSVRYQLLKIYNEPKRAWYLEVHQLTHT